MYLRLLPILFLCTALSAEHLGRWRRGRAIQPAAHAAADSMVLPVDFVGVIYADKDGKQTKPTVTREGAKAIFDGLNATWKQCGIQFGPMSYSTKVIPRPVQRPPDPQEVTKETEQISASLGIRPDSPEARNLREIARVYVASKDFTQRVFGKNPSQFDKRRLTVALVPKCRDFSDDLGNNFAVVRSNKSGHRDIAFNKDWGFNIGGGSVVALEGKAEVLVKYHTLGHEVGHLLTLNHDTDDALMHGQSPGGDSLPDTLFPWECSRARLELKRRMDPGFASEVAKAHASLAKHIFEKDEKGVKKPASKAVLDEVFITYDELPPFLQRLFSELEEIVIVPKISGMEGMNAQILREKKEGTFSLELGAQMLKGEATQQFLTRKEQGFFKEAPKPNEYGQIHPWAWARQRQTSNAALTFLVIHELGHVVDLRGSKEFRTRWEELSKTPSESEKLRRLPFPDGTLDRSKQDETYKALMESPFVTLYGANDELEDFAEFFAFAVADKFLGFRYLMMTESEKSYDLLAHYKSDLLKPKRDFVNSVIERLEKQRP